MTVKKIKTASVFTHIKSDIDHPLPTKVNGLTLEKKLRTFEWVPKYILLSLYDTPSPR